MWTWTWARGIPAVISGAPVAPTPPLPNVINSQLPDHQLPQVFTMAPVPIEPEFNYKAIALVIGHGLVSLSASIQVGRSLCRSYRALGPAQDTRERRAQRSTWIPIFAALAALSLSVATYGAVDYGILSYKVWANQRDVQVPARFYGDKGIFPPNENATVVHLGRWLTDTAVHLDALEILAEKARRFWWAQQLDLGLIPWNLLLAIEGRRRNIPLLWCYSLLGQFVSLSYAQNLFFVALLLTPSPLPLVGNGLPVSRYVRVRNAIFPPKPANWMPHPVLWVLSLLCSLSTAALAPHFANTPSIVTLASANRALVFAPLLLHYVVPLSWGVTYAHPHQAYGTYTSLFNFVSVASFLLHAKATVMGLAYNAPESYRHRHSVYIPFDIEQRSAWERTTSAFGKVLGAMTDHPVVATAGYDVLLSALAVGLWAAVRGTDSQIILSSTVPGLQVPGSTFKGDPSVREEAKAKATNSHGDSDPEPPTPLRRGRPRKVKQEHETESEAAYEPTASEAASVAEGDEMPAAGASDWEATALTWGLSIIGGLGVGTAGVLGAECIAR